MEANTYDIIVLAAHDIGRAGAAAANPNNIDGRAGEADKDIEALDDEVEQAEDH